MNQDIFRKQALERLSSPEQLDRLMPVTRPRAWAALAGIGLLMLVLGVWLIFGSVKTAITGYGTLERLDGISYVNATVGGTLMKLSVNVDDEVKRGQTLAFIVPSEPSGAEPMPLLSPADGRILDIHFEEKRSVAEGDTVFNVESYKKNLSGMLFVAAPDAYRVKVGMAVKVLPATSSQYQADYLMGRVTYAGRHPVEPVQQATWYDGATVRPMLKVVVSFENTGSRPEIYSGTPCQGDITVEARRPIDILFPVPRR